MYVCGVLTVECYCLYLVRDCNSVLSLKTESQLQDGLSKCEGMSFVGLFLHLLIVLSFCITLEICSEKPRHNKSVRL